MSALRSGGTDNLCTVIDNHADLIDESVETVEIVANGLLRLTKTDGSTVDVTIPFFSNEIVNGIDFTLGTNPNADVLDYTTGNYQINAQLYTLTLAGSISLAAGDTVNPRIDVVYLDATGIFYLQGTAAVSPIPPTVPANSIVAAYVNVDINADNTGGYSITPVSKQNFNIDKGNASGEILVWNNATETWTRNESLLIEPDTLRNRLASIEENIINVSTAVTLPQNSYIVSVNVGSNYIITLPATPETGRIYRFYANTLVAGNTVTIQTPAFMVVGVLGDVVSTTNLLPKTTKTYTSVDIIYDGTNWRKLNEHYELVDLTTNQVEIFDGSTFGVNRTTSLVTCYAETVSNPQTYNLGTQSGNYRIGQELVFIASSVNEDLSVTLSGGITIDGDANTRVVSFGSPLRIVKITSTLWAKSN